MRPYLPLLCEVHLQFCCAQGVRTQQMDVYGLFRPLFQGIAKEMPKSLVRIDSRVR